jgi:hypothetical protein
VRDQLDPSIGREKLEGSTPLNGSSLQLLSAHLEQADSAMFDIIENVGWLASSGIPVTPDPLGFRSTNALPENNPELTGVLNHCRKRKDRSNSST